MIDHEPNVRKAVDEPSRGNGLGRPDQQLADGTRRANRGRGAPDRIRCQPLCVRMILRRRPDPREPVGVGVREQDLELAGWIASRRVRRDRTSA